MSIRATLLLSLALVISVSLAGCTAEKVPAPGDAKEVASKGHSHDGWWCDEHGVPESECAQCNVKLVADFKAKNDWCEKHNRPDSHCFICHPEKESEYAALYEAKYGKKPPKPETGIDEDETEAAPKTT